MLCVSVCVTLTPYVDIDQDGTMWASGHTKSGHQILTKWRRKAAFSTTTMCKMCALRHEHVSRHEARVLYHPIGSIVIHAIAEMIML